MQRVGFVLKRDKPEATAIARELVPWLIERGCEVVVASENAEIAPEAAAVAPEELGGRIDLLVVLGGDGTFLHGGGVVGERQVPVLGINLGKLGFLVPFDPAEARDALERALRGALPMEERFRFRVRLHRVAGGVPVEKLALNDAVISQAGMARLAELDTRLDGQRIARYRADGLILSTPTGSTAYNLAAGGPILAPGQQSVVVTPICPHTLTNRPLVVPSASRIEVELGEGARGIVLTVDGQWAWEMAGGDRVEVTGGAAPLRVFRSEKTYFEILREKLMWGSGAT